MRPVGKADKPPAWKGSSMERWQEFTVSLQAWHVPNKDFMTEAQAIHKVYQMFREAGEPTAADSLTSYLLLGNNIPSFSHILYDIDNLFKVNRVSNSLDIVNELNLKSSSATETVAKIEKLSKLVVGGNVTIRNIFMAQAIKDNIPDMGKIAMINTLAYLDRESEIMRFTEFKSAFKQTFAATLPHETILDRITLGITTLRITVRAEGTGQIVGPGTPEGSTSPHTRPGPSVLDHPTDPTPAVIEVTQITGQVLRQ